MTAPAPPALVAAKLVLCLALALLVVYPLERVGAREVTGSLFGAARNPVGDAYGRLLCSVLLSHLP